MTTQEIIEAVEISMAFYGREATIKALNEMYHAGKITIEQVFELLDTLNK